MPVDPNAPPMPPPIAPTSTFKRTVPDTSKAPPPAAPPPAAPPTMQERDAHRQQMAARIPRGARAAMGIQQPQQQRMPRQQPRAPGAGGTEAVFPTDGGAIRNGNMGGGGAFNMSPFKNQAGPWGQQTKAPMSTGRANPFAGPSRGGFAR